MYMNVFMGCQLRKSTPSYKFSFYLAFKTRLDSKPDAECLDMLRFMLKASG